MTTFPVTVTYENRFHILKQVIDGALREGVCKVIVVDNDLVPQSREQLKAYEQELGSNRIKVLYLDDNYGSADGFKIGLEEAYRDEKCEFIWLLDDVNKPETGSLFYLLNYWNNYKNKNLTLLSNRIDRRKFIEAMYHNQSNIILGRKNKHLGFHIYDLFNKLLNRFLHRKKLYIKNDTKSFQVPIAPYGGLFLHKDMLEEIIGYPHSSFKLYVDDSEFTYRITLDSEKIND